MSVKGRFETDEIVKSTQHYKLSGKRDIVMQNTGANDVKVGSRTLSTGDNLRLAGELTILTNEHIKIEFIGAGINQLWVHYNQPLLEECSK